METTYKNDESLVRALEKSGDLPRFEQWINALETEIKNEGEGRYGLPLHKHTGLECWFGYFNDGYSARDTLTEDASYE